MAVGRGRGTRSSGPVFFFGLSDFGGRPPVRAAHSGREEIIREKAEATVRSLRSSFRVEGWRASSSRDGGRAMAKRPLSIAMTTDIALDRHRPPDLQSLTAGRQIFSFWFPTPANILALKEETIPLYGKRPEH